MAEATTSTSTLSAEYLAQNRGAELTGIGIAFAAATTVMLGLRFFAKRLQGGGVFADDIFLVAAYVINLGMCASGIVMVRVGGVGRHIEFVEENEPALLAGWAKSILAFELVYFTSVALPKLGIICLYLRIFNWKGAMKTAALVLFTLTAMLSVSLVVSACFQCIPLAYWWDRTIPGGSCFDVQGFFHAQAVPGAILDLAIMALPIGTIWHLNMPTVKRVALLMVFLVASFGIVASIIRAKVFFGTAAFSDRTWASVDLVGWSIIETGTYIIAGCLPHMRPLATHYTPDWLKKALSVTVGSISRSSKSKGFSSSSGYQGHSKKSKTRTLDDDAIELTSSSRNQWSGLHSPLEMDIEREAGKDMLVVHSQAIWPNNSQDHADMSPTVQIGGSKDVFGARVESPVTPGHITVTTEVKMIRTNSAKGAKMTRTNSAKDSFGNRMM